MKEYFSGEPGIMQNSLNTNEIGEVLKTVAYKG